MRSSWRRGSRSGQSRTSRAPAAAYAASAWAQCSGLPIGRCRSVGRVAAQGRREHLGEDVLGLGRAVGHVEPRGGDGVGKGAGLAAGASEVVVEAGASLGVLLGRRVVRRRQPAVRQRRGGGDPAIRSPGAQPDLRARFGQRCHRGSGARRTARPGPARRGPGRSRSASPRRSGPIAPRTATPTAS